MRKRGPLDFILLYLLLFFKSRLVTKYSKLKLYRTVIRPIVTYASETWVLKETIVQKLSVFERKILRRIFGPTKENQIWRIKTDEEKLQPANRSHRITHQQTSPILPRRDLAIYPPPHPHNRLRHAYYSYNYIGFIYNLKMADNLGRNMLL